MSNNCTTLYKYVSLEFIHDIIANQRLFLNDGSKFNDPFEVKITNRKTGKIEDITGLHILSLTNSHQNKLMWSHYGESHKGVCLAIDVPKKLVFPICYTGKRIYDDSNIDQILADINKNKNIKANLIKPFSSISIKKRYAYVKDQKWKYEKEYRIVFDEDDEHQLHQLIHEKDNWYLKVKIKRMYLGVNFHKNDPSKIKEILDTCKLNGIDIIYMKMSNSNYSVGPSRSSDCKAV